MRIRMTATAKGAVSSTDIREFGPGEHDMPDDLAEAFLSMGVAEPIVEPDAEPDVAAEPESKPKRRR